MRTHDWTKVKSKLHKYHHRHAYTQQIQNLFTRTTMSFMLCHFPIERTPCRQTLPPPRTAAPLQFSLETSVTDIRRFYQAMPYVAWPSDKACAALYHPLAYVVFPLDQIFASSSPQRELSLPRFSAVRGFHHFPHNPPNAVLVTRFFASSARRTTPATSNMPSSNHTHYCARRHSESLDLPCGEQSERLSLREEPVQDGVDLVTHFLEGAIAVRNGEA